jgi:hypothetical protein
MCNIVEERIRINKILEHSVGARLDYTPPNLDELTQLCVVALQLYYEGGCPEECLEAKARDFAVWHLARAGLGAWPQSRSSVVASAMIPTPSFPRLL